MKKILCVCVLSLVLASCSLPVVETNNNILRIDTSEDLQKEKQQSVTVANSLPAAEVKLPGAKSKIELRGVSLKDVLQVIFQEVLEYPYVLETDMKTDEKLYDISVSRGIKKSQLYKMCVQMLTRSGLAVDDVDGVLYVNSEEKRTSENRSVLAVYRGKNRKAVELSAALPGLLVENQKDNKVGITTDGKRSVIVSGDDKTVRKILRVLAEIDVPERQIISTLQVCEVTLIGDLKWGLEYYLKAVAGGVTGVLASPTISSGGFSFSLLTNNRIDTELTLLEKHGIVKVISRPILVTVDGKSSSLHVGTDIPILDTVKETDDDNLYQTVKYRNTGLKISINPNVISQDSISINLIVELSKGSQNSFSSLDSPLITSRQLETNLNLQSGKSVIIAGIVSQNIDSSETKIPGLQWSGLLGSASHESSKTELVIVLQSTIVETNHIDTITDAQFDKIRGIK